MKSWRALRYNKAKKEPMVLETHSEPSLVKAVCDAIVHVRRVMKRERQLDCRSERVGMFITSLRRELSNNNISYMKGICDKHAWEDAGVLKRGYLEKYAHLVRRGLEMAGQKNDVNYSLHELDSMTVSATVIAAQTNDLIKEADELLESLEQLAASI